jgi:CHASE3 domain sensor protein
MRGGREGGREREKESVCVCVRERERDKACMSIPAAHACRFLQLLCEGHNMRWQNYLRAQNNGIRNVDLVLATANYVIFCAPHI